MGMLYEYARDEREILTGVRKAAAGFLNVGTTYEVNGRPMVYRFSKTIDAGQITEHWFFGADGFSTALRDSEIDHKTVRC